MRVAVAQACTPFRGGIARDLAATLVRQLVAFGHQAEVVNVPLRDDTSQAVRESMLAASLMHVPMADRVIALNWPAYFVQHPQKVIWLLEHRDQAERIPAGDEGEPGAALARADSRGLRACDALYVGSALLRERVRRIDDLESEVLPPPLDNPELFRPGAFGDYVLAGGDIGAVQRQQLLVAAMTHVRSAVRLVIAGSVDSPSELEELSALVREQRLEDRVTVVTEHGSEDRRAQLVNGSLAAAYVPVNDESYGRAAAEACLAGKPVVTADDSGGVLALVTDGDTGRVTSPDPVALAATFDELFVEREVTRRLGARARDRVLNLNLSWEHVVAVLTS